MRVLMFLVALLAAGSAGYLATLGKTSYSVYSESQLTQLEAEHQRLLSKSRGDAADEQLLSLALVREERQRRLYLHGSAGAAALALVLSFVMRSRSRAPSSGEESRFLQSVGDPELSREGARYKAAELLGVRPDAPPAVIQAALQIQLAERDPADMTGHDPHLRQAALERREALIRAGDLLLGRHELPSSKVSSQN
ncbi:hypothetical protein [Archangium sp.]|uniref:hypothetical protein n=1 Tax=Archangium sp. TaxID=1872627 RepID=UPI00286A04A9|nr:hypothetical protein [Archangium sp.]